MGSCVELTGLCMEIESEFAYIGYLPDFLPFLAKIYIFAKN